MRSSKQSNVHVNPCKRFYMVWQNFTIFFSPLCKSCFFFKFSFCVFDPHALQILHNCLRLRKCTISTQTQWSEILSSEMELLWSRKVVWCGEVLSAAQLSSLRVYCLLGVHKVNHSALTLFTENYSLIAITCAESNLWYPRSSPTHPQIVRWELLPYVYKYFISLSQSTIVQYLIHSRSTTWY